MYIFFGILALLLVASAIFAKFTFAVSWYENANREPHLLASRFTAEALFLAWRLVATEVLVVFLSFLLHPLGWFPWREKAPEANGGTPVLFLHGLFQSPACWLWTMHRLRRHGFRNLYVLALPPWQGIEDLSARLAGKVDQLRLDAGVEKIHLVCHSMGGIVARNYLQFQGGAGKIDRCLLLGVPNQGSKMVPFALSPLAAHVMPGSELLRRLAAAPPPAGVRLTAIYSRHENIVLPFTSGLLGGAANVELSELGHTALLYHPRAFAPLHAALKEDTP